MELRELPPEYMREPVIAWSVVERDTHRSNDYTNKRGVLIHRDRSMSTVEAHGITPCPFDDFDCTEIDWDENPITHEQDAVMPKISTIPAAPGTFKILKEDEHRSMVDFCYEIGGIFTDYNFNEMMNGKDGERE